MESSQQATIAARLRAERARLGFSQAQMGSLGQVSGSSQHAYEAGTNRPDALYLANVAKAGVDVLYVLTGRPQLQIDWQAATEIAELVLDWNRSRGQPVPQESIAQFVQGFYEQFDSTRRLELARYATTLKHVG